MTCSPWPLEIWCASYSYAPRPSMIAYPKKSLGPLTTTPLTHMGGKESLVLRLGNTITTFKASRKLEFMPALRAEGLFDTESITIAEKSTKQFE